MAGNTGRIDDEGAERICVVIFLIAVTKRPRRSVRKGERSSSTSLFRNFSPQPVWLHCSEGSSEAEGHGRDPDGAQLFMACQPGNREKE